MPLAALPLPKDFYERSATEVAPDLLGKLLVRSDGGIRVGRIVEVEAYCGADDPAAHSRNGPTDRNASMFGPPGRLYVYLIYGIHWCANAVCASSGIGDAVLLRALEPICGHDAMTECRSRKRSGQMGRNVKGRHVNPKIGSRDLCSGPAKLTQAFDIDGRYNGCDLTTSKGLSICDDGWLGAQASVTERIGISRGSELLWRWYVTGNPYVSLPGR